MRAGVYNREIFRSHGTEYSLSVNLGVEKRSALTLMPELLLKDVRPSQRCLQAILQ